ncbi:unnamed protein product [Rotaria sp. Silwood1]|nr:unnamed protein product [Rotaria sp. Silwood1]
MCTYFYYILVRKRVSKEELPSSSLMLRRICNIFHVPNLLFHSMFGLILLGVPIGFEFAVPWKSNLNPRLLEKGTLNLSQALDNCLSLAAWPPTTCCAILNSFICEAKNHVAILFVLEAVGDSALSACLSKTIPLSSENRTNILGSILGEFLLLLGTRYAEGCTSGQGMSGKNRIGFSFAI